MKKIALIISSVSGIISSVNAQDYIKRTDGTEIIAKIISQTPVEVVFKNFHAQDRPAAKISKKDISVIEYENGIKDYYEKGRQVMPPVQKPTPPPLPPAPAASVSAVEESVPATLEADVNTGVLQQRINTLSKQIEAGTQTAKKQSEEQTKAIVESLDALTKAVLRLNTTTEQGNSDNADKNSEIINKLGNVNDAITELKENSNKKTEVYQLSKAGLSVNMVFAGLSTLYKGKTAGDDRFLMGTEVAFIFQGGLKKKSGFRFEGGFAYLYSVGDMNMRTSMFRGEFKLLGVAHLNKVNFFAGPSLMFGVGGNIVPGAFGGGIGGGFHLGGEYLVSDNFAISTSGGFNLFGTLYDTGSSTELSQYASFMGTGSFGVKYFFGRDKLKYSKTKSKTRE